MGLHYDSDVQSDCWELGLSESSPLFYLGPEGSHSHQAALNIAALIPELGQLTPGPGVSFLSMMEMTTQTPGAIGLLPVENALQGSVLEVLDCLGLQEFPLQPLVEFLCPIEHCLIVPPELATLQLPQEAQSFTVMSHPQALGQCRQTIYKLFGSKVTCQPTPSTSKAVKLLLDNPCAPDSSPKVAIGTRVAAERIGLPILNGDMSDAPNNQTRFFLVSASPERHSSWIDSLKATCPMKTSLCIGIPDKTGSLVELLQIFSRYGINLCKIESRPSKRKLGEYYFYIDVSTDLSGSAHESVRAELARHCTYLQQLRSYPCLGLIAN